MGLLHGGARVSVSLSVSVCERGHGQCCFSEIQESFVRKGKPTNFGKQ